MNWNRKGGTNSRKNYSRGNTILGNTVSLVKEKTQNPNLQRHKATSGGATDSSFGTNHPNHGMTALRLVKLTTKEQEEDPFQI